MEAKVREGHAPAVVVALEPGEELVSEAGAMMFMSGDVSMDVELPGGLVGGLKRAVLAGESLFLAKYVARGAGAVGICGPFPGSIRYVNFPAEQFTQVGRTLDTLRLNLLSLHQIHLDSRGSLQVLGEIQRHVDAAQGHEETLEALGELGSWQADQLAIMGSTLQSIDNTSIVAASYQINQDARNRQTTADVLQATTARAQADAAESKPSYTLVPTWVPPL